MKITNDITNTVRFTNPVGVTATFKVLRGAEHVTVLVEDPAGEHTATHDRHIADAAIWAENCAKLGWTEERL